jgi:hypothetical protein
MTIDLFGKIHTFTHQAHKGRKKKYTRNNFIHYVIYTCEGEYLNNFKIKHLHRYDQRPEH